MLSPHGNPYPIYAKYTPDKRATQAVDQASCLSCEVPKQVRDDLVLIWNKILQF
jgi:hypothetical protein